MYDNFVKLGPHSKNYNLMSRSPMKIHILFPPFNKGMRSQSFTTKENLILCNPDIPMENCFKYETAKICCFSPLNPSIQETTLKFEKGRIRNSTSRNGSEWTSKKKVFQGSLLINTKRAPRFNADSFCNKISLCWKIISHCMPKPSRILQERPYFFPNLLKFMIP